MGTAIAVALLSAACNADDTAEQTAESTPPAEMQMPTPPPMSEPAAGAAFLDPNSAPADQLATVPGFDQALADAVVAGRPYENMLGVDQVIGTRLTDEQKDLAYARLWLPLDLNSAAEDEILLIPGVGDRMAHEFEEYRPYDGIERFRREIGKYVDSTEVARLEQYVTIR
jgi:DNA uptake protein ComE-like DNA-binding protein